MKLTGRPWGVTSDVVDFRSPLGIIELHRTKIRIVEWRGSRDDLIRVAGFLGRRIVYGPEVIAEVLGAFDAPSVRPGHAVIGSMPGAPLDMQPEVDDAAIVGSDVGDEPAADVPENPPVDDDESPDLDF